MEAQSAKWYPLFAMPNFVSGELREQEKSANQKSGKLRDQTKA
jgi:hypothetical protein